jgi:hypothetical protein
MLASGGPMLHYVTVSRIKIMKTIILEVRNGRTDSADVSEQAP